MDVDEGTTGRDDVGTRCQQRDYIGDALLAMALDSAHVEDNIGVERHDAIEIVDGHHTGSVSARELAGVYPDFGRVIDTHPNKLKLGGVNDGP